MTAATLLEENALKKVREYRRRCSNCRRPMTATRGPLAAKERAYADAVLAWTCPDCRIEIQNPETEASTKEGR